VVPALAVADALRAEGAEVTFVGGDRAEAALVPAAGYPLRAISVEGLSRTNPLRALRALARAALAVRRARALLASLRVDAVMGGGGYVAGPVALAALTLRVPVVLTEADSHLGLTNRILAPFARSVCLAFPPADGRRRVGWRRRGLPLAVAGDGRGGYLVTGRPIAPPWEDRAAARARFGIGDGEPCVLVFGGSLGARSINEAALEAFADAPFRVLHLCGERDYARLAARPLRVGYDLRGYLGLDDFTASLAAADLVVARAGGSVFEIAASGRPAILVPYPRATGDHQTANARWMSDAGAAVVIADGELTAARLGEVAARLLGDGARLTAMGQASRGLARPQAARDVAAELLKAAAV
jgi:UDP-N-acetylglucosamine--N-acetylmuramyl-(pentapeptide) pyrophosphoryl-undecaprenol N-acetylglucosamine transferase